ncbi:MAG: hypothetical protein ACEY3D_08845 [Rickettsia sp.]|uniref:hypothetical protein n=1 Tax=Rickettsia sp. TaxID=789 RepID=UPI003978A776
MREHFELHAAEYDKNPDRTAINELHAMVRKVDLAEELGVSPEPQEIALIQAIPNINEKQEVIKQDLNKAINQVHEKYSGRPIPKEEMYKIANIIVHNEGYPHHIEIMKIEKMDKTVEKKQVKDIDQQLAIGPKKPDYTPNKPEPKNKGKGEGRG